MGKIQELSEQLANQIAAGEVVERPASVVKELVENAIDAGANQIDIFIEEAGLQKIQIIDNGEGIADEDVENAFKRHATSKIHSRNDLFRIRTLGFRGEALPSIASVSQVTLETAVAGAEKGTLLVLAGGKVTQHEAAPLRQGTKITVENLFFNTPARLKYVKTLQTELANVGDIVNRLALSHPKIAFRLVHEGNKMLVTAGNGDLKQTIAGIFGVATAKKMLPIAMEDLDFQINGYVSLPEVTRASRNYMSTIINGRYIKNFALNKAIVNGYGSKLMIGRFPIAVIEITMDPLLVDVNVHPTKQEVRLSKEKELMALLSQGITEVLASQNLIPNAADNLGFKKKQPLPPVAERPEQLAMELPASEAGTTAKTGLAFDAKTGSFYLKEAYPQDVDKPVENPGEKEVASPAFDSQSLKSEAREPDFSVISEESPETQESVKEVTAAPAETYPQEAIAEDEDFSYQQETHLHPEFDFAKDGDKSLERALQQVEAVPQERFPQLDYFGQMHGTYLFAQSHEGLYIIDQHAAQERIKYEYFREKIGEVSNDLQDLLVPIVLDYPNSDALKLKEQLVLLQEVGIYLEEFGANSFILRAHPTWYPEGEEESIVREMIDMLLTTGTVSVKKFREATAIMMSCKRSIKANHHLNDLQARVLLEDLARCENPFNCPHGRPVLIHFTNSDMEKMFKRIQDPHRTKDSL